MFERILQGLHEVEGVQATIVVDAVGAILGSRAHPVYDQNLLEHVGQFVVSAVDSIQLIQDDWEMVTASYSDGKVLIRSVRPGNQQNVNYLLAVIADIRLNPSFAGVAVRVAASKLRAELESPTAAGSAVSIPAPTATMPPPAGSRPPANRSPSVSARNAASAAVPASSVPPAAPRVDLAASAHSWSGLGRSSGSGASASGVAVADEAASRYLTACTKALSNCVGPMAKVFVKDAVRLICRDRAFSRDDGAALVAELERHIHDQADLEGFYAAMQST